MTTGSGLAASIGFGDETTWGVPVVPTVWVPMVDESISHEIMHMESNSTIAGARVQRSSQWAEGGVNSGGDIGLELNDLSKGLLLKHMFGGSSTTGPFSPADLTGLGLTVQVGVPDTTGTIHPKTLAGGKVASWEVACVVDEIATLGLSVIGKHLIHYRTVADGVLNTSTTVTSATAAFTQDDVGKPISATGITAGTTVASVQSATSLTLSAAATATASGVTLTIGVALTAVSYAANILPMSFVGGTVSMAGSAASVKEITLSGENSLQDDRRFLGARARAEPLEVDLRNYSGEIGTEYFSDVMYQRFLAGSETALSLTVARGTKSILFEMNVRYDGTTPQVGDKGIVGQTLPFKVLGPTTDAGAITVTLDET